MHLSNLKLVGFKSFHQETNISFEPGVTAIVGPNGCGKSNICDAIRWVLGEQGHRPLRAERMEDIIFNGNGTYQPLGVAEASITISGHEGRLPTEFSEINITRRLFRSGESEYFLNGSPCLLRDILNLFLDSGLGNTPYALIEQGAVASVIDAKPWERKAMVDEAAGIMKYRLRRKAAIAKLEAAEQNLLRLGDIIGEVEQQRNSLNRQAKKAKEYEELRKRIEYLEGYLRIRDYDCAKEELEKVNCSLEERSAERSCLVNQAHQNDVQLESERLELLKLDGIFQETQQSYYRFKGEMEKVSAQADMLAQEAQESGKMEQKIQADFSSSMSKIELLQKELAEEEKKGGALGEMIDCLARREEELQQREKGLAQEVVRLSELVEEKRREAIQAAAHCSNIRNQSAALENQGHRLFQQKEKLKAQNEAASSEMDETREKDAMLEMKLKDLELNYAAWESQRSQAAIALANTLEEEREINLVLSGLQRQIDEFSTRLHSYEDLQSSFLGYGDGAQLLLQNRRTSGGTEVLMPLTELLEATFGCEKAIEALLNSEVQGLVMEGLQEIRRVIQELEPLQKGGAIFLPLSFPSVSWGPEIPSDPLGSFAPSSKIIGRAIDLIRYDSRYESLMKRLFSHSLVVEDLETALELCRKCQPPPAIATLKGEVITSKGAIRLPSASSSGLLVRRQQIKDLTKKLNEAREELVQVQARKGTLEGLLGDLTERSESLEKEGQRLQIERVAIEKDRNQTAINLERIGQQREVIGFELRTIEEEIAQLNAELVGINQGKKEQEDRHQACEGEIRELQASLEILKAQHKEVLGEKKSCEEELRFLEEERRARELQVARMEEQINSLFQRRQQLQGESIEVQQRRSKIEGSLREKEKIISDLEQKEAEVSGALRGIRDQRQEISLQLAKREEELKRLKRKISGLDESLNDLKIKKAEIDQEMQHLCQYPAASPLFDFTQLQAQHEKESMETSAAQEELIRHRERCQKLEPVNMAALVDHEVLSKRFSFLNSQAEDLRSSVSSLRQTISEINKTTQRLFGEAFDCINQNFKEFYTRLFEGGDAKIRLTGGGREEEGELGVELMVSPPGKHLAHLDLLSGGEKALAGLAFLLALFKYRPSPFCFLDEVDAPLDDANVERYLSLLKEFSQQHQFILITHNKKTMEAADSLYGVTMEQPGVSMVVSVKFDENEQRKDLKGSVKSFTGERNGD